MLFASRMRLVALMLLVLCATPLFANHSLTVRQSSIVVGNTQTTFVAYPTASDSLNVPMTPMICAAPGPLVTAGSPHTFTSVGEEFVFTITYPAGSYPSPQVAYVNQSGNVIIAVTDEDTTDCNNGSEGFITVEEAVAIAPVPAVPPAGLAVLAGLLAVAGLLIVRRQ